MGFRGVNLVMISEDLRRVVVDRKGNRVWVGQGDGAG